jgi:hypothetical protein
MVFKKFRARTKSRGFFRRNRRVSSKSSGMSVEKLALTSAGYGIARPYVANLIPDVVMLGGYSDNIILGVAGYLACKKGSGIIKTAGYSVLATEAFLVTSKYMSSSTGTQSSGFVYG